MIKPILEIQNISKKFRINSGNQPYLSLRDKFNSIFENKKKSKEDFWALRNINFEVNPGESIGIIGKNGAGKSTLLKILSKITPPTNGKIISRGRIASLLEVGTGFHPELNGRENIYLNGSILGMKKNEINSKLDEIIDFSGVEKFLETPLKHYSSGMQLRLAFAVAAFLEPEILIIDEVLAVGDAEFQQKCLWKMNEVSQSGRTILFVSHNLGAVKSLCKKAILIDKGEILKIGDSNEILDYYSNNSSLPASEFIVNVNKEKQQFGFVEKISIEDENGSPASVLNIGCAWRVKVSFSILEEIPHFIVAIGFATFDGFPLRTTWTKPKLIKKGKYECVFQESNIILTKGKYKIFIGLSSHEQTFHYVQDLAYCEFEDFVDKSLYVNSNSGIILNQMSSEITKLD